MPARGADREARLWLSGLLFFVAFYSLHLPLASRLLATGFAGWQVGLILGALGPAALAGRIVAGPLADGIGGPRLMAAGAGLLALSAIVFSDSRSFPVLILARTLQALGYAAFSTAAAAVAGVLAPGEESIPALSRQGTAANVAMAATTWLLASRPSPDQPLHTWAALLACLGGALAFRLPAAESGRPSQRDASAWPVPGAARLPTLAAALSGAGFAAVSQFAAVGPDGRATSAGLVYGAGILSTRLLLSRTSPRARLGLPGPFALLAAGLLLLAGHSSAVKDGVAVLLVAAGLGLLHPLLLALHLSLQRPAERGRAVAVYYVGFDLGIGVGGWLFGLVVPRSGAQGVFAVASALTATGVLVSLAMERQKSLDSRSRLANT